VNVAANLQGKNLKVGGKTYRPSAIPTLVPNPWKQEGTQSCEKQRVSKGLCGIGFLENACAGFRSDHPELRKTSTCYVVIMSHAEIGAMYRTCLRNSRLFRQSQRFWVATNLRNIAL
jgi:hypothetical protein